MADDFGYECLSCDGSKDYQTPNLDRLAETGIRFEHCYANPVCTPSRDQIMTGRYNHRNYEGFGYLNPNETTFGNLLKQVGYRTAIVGKWQLSGDAQTVQDFGFENHCLWNMHAYKVDETGRQLPDPETWRNRYWAPALFIDGEWKLHSEDQYGPDICRDYALSFIDKHRDEPFFLYYPMMLTHDPFLPTPDSEGKGSQKENFTDMVEYTDKVVGQVINHLEELGLREKTLILFTGDNGTHRKITTQTVHGEIKGGKAEMTDAGTRVPFIINWPGTTPSGIVLEDLIDFSDFMPTLVELTGAKLPEDRVIDGRSFLPQIQGEKGNPRDWIFCHYWGNRGRTAEGSREFARDQRWKLYDDGQLFDIGNDPLEKSPLKELSPEAEAARQKLQKAIESLH
ncbi:MAG: sulfatase-like hydrolase/transferase [Candidatus Omnitrophica bacterium]|nr:sulfatase-like hydrolase/transferase [Candidatus Omnitrophota bacterium]